MRLTIKGEYPADWQDIARQVKHEADNRCVRCGHRDGDRMKGGVKKRIPCDALCRHPQDDKLRQLTVHHLDGDKGNCRWWNLLPLCQLCHLSVQARVIPERPFLWEHTDWFKPYAAGFYAYWYDQQELTRSEVEAQLDRWLRLGQPWLYSGGSVSPRRN